MNPDTFPLSLSILMLASLVLGGLGSLLGVHLRRAVLEFLPIYAQEPPLLRVRFSKQAPSVVFGVVLIVIVFVAPGGLVGLLRRRWPMMVRLRMALGEQRGSRTFAWQGGEI